MLIGYVAILQPRVYSAQMVHLYQCVKKSSEYTSKVKFSCYSVVNGYIKVWSAPDIIPRCTYLHTDSFY